MVPPSRNMSPDDAIIDSERRSKRGQKNVEEWQYLYQDQEGFEKAFISQEKGYGLVATRFFEKGSFLLFYRGRRISRREADLKIAVRFEEALI